MSHPRRRVGSATLVTTCHATRSLLAATYHAAHPFGYDIPCSSTFAATYPAASTCQPFTRLMATVVNMRLRIVAPTGTSGRFRKSYHRVGYCLGSLKSTAESAPTVLRQTWCTAQHSNFPAQGWARQPSSWPGQQTCIPIHQTESSFVIRCWFQRTKAVPCPDIRLIRPNVKTRLGPPCQKGRGIVASGPCASSYAAPFAVNSTTNMASAQSSRPLPLAGPATEERHCRGVRELTGSRMPASPLKTTEKRRLGNFRCIALKTGNKHAFFPTAESGDGLRGQETTTSNYSWRLLARLQFNKGGDNFPDPRATSCLPEVLGALFF